MNSKENENKVPQIAVEAKEPETKANEPLEVSDVGPQARLVGVALDDGKVLEFDPVELTLAVGDLVIVDNDRDLNLGKVVFTSDNHERKSLKKIVRRVGSEDLLLIRRNKRREEEAFAFCRKRIIECKLPMKLVRVAYLHGGNKAIFYFTADGRVDFRALVRDLAQQLHVRIEMRQIGVRDEAKMLGSIGVCGQHICCSRFLRKFVPVSIKMAKNQNLALNPQKLSGICGRLMCCLVYEDGCYRQMRKGLPKSGDIIDTPEGQGKVLETEILSRKVKVQIDQRVVIVEVDKLDNTFKVLSDRENSDELDDFDELEERPDLRQLLDEQPRVEDSIVRSEPNSRSKQVPPFSITRPFEKNRKSHVGEDMGETSDQGRFEEQENPQKRQRAKKRSRRKSRQKRKIQAEGAQRARGELAGGPGDKK